ncbi:MAG TPA: tetratricopeptide repeat protein [Ornithinibacter sp.]|nr:tetratricopeptide repeat protein [Ornithinibacter sp.]
MDDLPSTELTMLFTDIEGSTRLLNRLGPAYTDVLASHRGILRRAFDGTGGREMGTEGDSFFVVFGSAADAVTAAAEGQRGLAAHAWPEGVSLRVRMGLHTGHPEVFEDDLVGLDVHLAARVSAAAHGGQVVLTEATAERSRGRLPPGTVLVGLGTHRLKDIEQPQHLHQLVVPGLPGSFAPLRSLGAPGSLPVPATGLVGREAELWTLSTLLTREGPRLVTLTGPGGSGKTRLSLAVAHEVAAAHVDGVHFVGLDTATQDDVAWTAIAEALGRTGETEDGLLEHLQDRAVLLVLDNLEQLGGSGASVVGRLLRGTRRLRVLATSRGPLRVPGEQEYPVPPLGLPDRGAAPTVEAAARAGSVRLFVQQAQLVDPSFMLTEDNVADVVTLCARLDGLPLAVELAAARVRLLPPRALLAHLDEALGLPLAGHPERQQTLRATVDWSYRMVGDAGQSALRALTVFGAAGGTFDAVATVLDVPSSLPVVSSLLDGSLVRVDDDPGGARVRMLQTVRAVVRDLVSAGELDLVQRRHAHHYLQLAEREGSRLRGPDAMAARSAIEREVDNLRMALDWALADPGDEGPGDDDRTAVGIRLCTALATFWYRTGYDEESGRWLELATRAAARHQGPQLARLLHMLGLRFLQHGEPARAKEVLAKALLLWRRAGDREGESRALNSLGVAHRNLDDAGRARALLRDSAEVARSAGNRQREATALSNLSILEVDAGNPASALPLLERAERLDLELGNAWGVAADRVNRASALLSASRPLEAIDLVRELATTVTGHGDPDLTLDVVELAAVAASLTGDHARAVRLAACADAQRTAGGFPLAEPDRAQLHRHLDRSRQALGDDAPGADRAGRALTVAGALTEAVELRGADPAPSVDGPRP